VVAGAQDGGYTQFCCTMTGVNTCPPGIDHRRLVARRGLGLLRRRLPVLHGLQRLVVRELRLRGSGTCSPECAGTSCRCANNDCGNWKVGCTRFRYGQCNQNVECVGPIECRVITCVPPWEWDSSCTRSDAVDQNTRTHDAACLHPFDTGDNPPVLARPGVVSSNAWALRDNLTTGSSQSDVHVYGLPGDVPLMADFSGSGIETRRWCAAPVSASMATRPSPGTSARSLDRVSPTSW
jgi:hypothetical protein